MWIAIADLDSSGEELPAFPELPGASPWHRWHSSHSPASLFLWQSTAHASDFAKACACPGDSSFWIGHHQNSGCHFWICPFSSSPVPQPPQMHFSFPTQISPSAFKISDSGKLLRYLEVGLGRRRIRETIAEGEQMKPQGLGPQGLLSGDTIDLQRLESPIRDVVLISNLLDKNASLGPGSVA